MSNYIPATAPYNFVSFPDKLIYRYNSADELPRHDELLHQEDGFYSGEIRYVIKNDSPMIVGSDDNGNTKNKTKKFFTNHEGKYTIPGSTVRGLVKNNMKILGLADPSEDIQPSVFLYRDWTSVDSKRQSDYKKAIGINGGVGSRPTNVCAGFISKTSNGDYKIRPSKEICNKSYAYVKENFVRKTFGNDININYMYEDMELKRPSKGFKPYWRKDISFSVNNDGGISSMAGDNSYAHKGRLMCSNYIGMQRFYKDEARKAAKKVHYVVYEPDLVKETILLKKDSITIRSYIDDLERKKMMDKPFFRLPEIGEKERPVFYIQYNGQYSIGMTPYLRIMYKHGVHDGIGFMSEATKVDYVKGLFGFIDRKDKKGYKTRLSFSDAVSNDAVPMKQSVSLLLGEPKATWYTGYLNQDKFEDGIFSTYNDEDFSLRGYKQYWLQKGISKGPEGNGNKNVLTEVFPVESATYEGSIRFENITKDELGLLVYSLKLEEGCKQNLGNAKALGYGKFHYEKIDVLVNDLDAIYSSLSYINKEKYFDVEELIEYYKQYVKTSFGMDLDINTTTVNTIKEFIYIKSHEIECEKVVFMKLGEYGKKRVLPYVMEYDKRVSDYLNNPGAYVDFHNKGNNGNVFKKYNNNKSGQYKYNKRKY